MSIPAKQPQNQEDIALDSTLRPNRWDEYIGQKSIKENLRILIDAAKKRSSPLEHLLFYGPAGLGKTTLAHLISREMGSQMKVTSGPAIERVGDLAAILTNLSTGDILFIDEAHRLNKMIEEILYPAMEAGSLDIIIGKGPAAAILPGSRVHDEIILASDMGDVLANALEKDVLAPLDSGGGKSVHA